MTPAELLSTEIWTHQMETEISKCSPIIVTPSELLHRNCPLTAIKHATECAELSKMFLKKLYRIVFRLASHWIETFGDICSILCGFIVTPHTLPPLHPTCYRVWVGDAMFLFANEKLGVFLAKRICETICTYFMFFKFLMFCYDFFMCFIPPILSLSVN